jgi:23S rRNA G2445 N2-methylase RlmL
VSFFATAAKGTEPALRDELREIGLAGVRADRGGVHFEGGMEDGARACLSSRIAVRVLTPLAAFDAPSGDALYDGIAGIDWRPYLTADRSLAVRAVCRSSALTHTQFIAQRTKDAIVDQLRQRLGARPSVDLEDPDVSVFVHLVKDRATAYLDLAGEPLHRRGYRVRMASAPLKETLAAAVVRMSGWDRISPFCDPMCGSGTLAIEAALWASGVAPGLSRKRFGFERWAMHDAAAERAIADLRGASRARPRRPVPEVLASDLDADAVAATTENARAAGVTLRVEQQKIGALRLPPPPPSFQVVVNPPYGERLAGGAALAEEIAAAMSRNDAHRWTLLVGSPEVGAAVRRRPSGVHALFNGPIECRLLTYAPR